MKKGAEGRHKYFTLVAGAAVTALLISGGILLVPFALLADRAAIAGNFLAAVSMLGVLITLLMQKEELALQREESAASRKEFHEQAKALRESAKIYASQLELQRISVQIQAHLALLTSLNAQAQIEADRASQSASPFSRAFAGSHEKEIKFHEESIAKLLGQLQGLQAYTDG